MAGKVLRLRRADMCSRCGAALEVGTQASWDAQARSVTCLPCMDGVTPAATIDHGHAGASAHAKYERLHQRREEAIDQRWGRLAGVVKFLTDDPQSTQAWRQGSIGERKLAESLDRDLGDRVILLNDRREPKTRGNFDHVAIAASGVWIIDTKRYSGRVERRDVGGWFEIDERLVVGGRDQTKLTHAMGWQLDAVRTVLAGVEVPITPVLCFIDAEWGRFTKPIRMNGVVVVWRKKLAEMIGAPGPLSSDDVRDIATRISVALPPVK